MLQVVETFDPFQGNAPFLTPHENLKNPLI